jgi:hypothetical protein
VLMNDASRASDQGIDEANPGSLHAENTTAGKDVHDKLAPPGKAGPGVGMPNGGKPGRDAKAGSGNAANGAKLRWHGPGQRILWDRA